MPIVLAAVVGASQRIPRNACRQPQAIRLGKRTRTAYATAVVVLAAALWLAKSDSIFGTAFWMSSPIA